MFETEDEKIYRYLKTILFAVLLIGSGYFFGTICERVEYAYTLILFPSRELVSLFLWFLLAAGVLLVSAGLVAALLRPVWIGVGAFALAGLAMLLGWRVTVVSSILVLLYFAAASLYVVGVVRGLNERIRFSVHPIGESQGMLLSALLLVACGSLYLGYAAQVEREGFSIPEYYLEMVRKPIEQRIEAEVPAEEREEAIATFREEFQGAIDAFSERTLKPYERFIPLGLAAAIFTSLMTITHLLAWVPTVVLRLVFPLLTALGVTEIVRETQEVQRLVIG